MIITNIIGNIGNQMFIYAMARAWQLETKQQLTFDLSGLKWYYYTANYKLDQFCISDDINYNLKKVNRFIYIRYILSSKLFRLQHIFFRHTRKDLLIPNNVISWWFKHGCLYNTNRPFYKYDPNNSKDYFIYGYFQSEKYFYKYKKIISEELRVKRPLSEYENGLIAQMNNCNSIAVSIRAAVAPENDKVKDNLVLGFIEKDYYFRAMDVIAEKVESPVFFIFADNIDIVKADYKFKYPVKYVTPEDSSSGIRLMYSCKHFVIANSTFSWWGAYLSDYEKKIVVMPKKFDRFGPNREDIYFDNVIKLEVSFKTE